MKEEEHKQTSNIGMLIAVGVAIILLIAFGVASKQATDAKKEVADKNAQLANTEQAMAKYREDGINCEVQLRAAQDQSDENTNRVELVYITPKAGCTTLCDQMRPMVETAADEIGFFFRPVMLPTNLSMPGMYILNKDTMSEIFPINSKLAMDFVFCNKFNLTERCEQAPVGLNNTPPVIVEVNATVGNQSQ